MPTMRRSISHARRQAQRKQKRQNKAILALAIILIAGGLGTLLWMGIESQTGNSYTPPAVMQEGNAALDFQLASLDNGDVALSDYQDQVVIMNMWATWCPPCRAEMPGLNRFYEAHKDEGMVVLAVNGQEPEETVRPFIEANNFTFPVLLDIDGAVARQYTARSFPTTFIIDRNGRIQHVQVGEITERELEQIVTPLLQ